MVKRKTKIQEVFDDEYKKIVKSSDGSVVINVEWNNNGDNFQKLSLYDNYTPVQTSGSTKLITQL